MRRILLATHGKMASGVENTLRMFVGEELNISCVDAYVENGDNYLDEIEKFINEVGNKDEGVVFTDILGGSVNQQIFSLLHNSTKNIYLVTNMNLPIIISVILESESLSLEKLESLIEECKIQIVHRNNDSDETNEDDFFD